VSVRKSENLANGGLQQLALGYNGQNETCGYAHDDLSRIASASSTGSGWSQTFTCDAFGTVAASLVFGQWPTANGQLRS
jgi:hypothetical protein